jgi:hypothetical protein
VDAATVLAERRAVALDGGEAELVADELAQEEPDHHGV